VVATPIAASTRYYPPGTREVYWVPAIANTNAPTRAELDAGTNLTGEISAMAGFSVASATVSVPDLANRFAPDIPGQITSASSSITMYTSEDSQDVRQLMPRDTAGFVVVLWEGDTPGRLMDVFPVTVTSAPKDVTTTNAGTLTIDFAVTSVPVENAVIPAS
jgi:hypothetical protein